MRTDRRIPGLERIRNNTTSRIKGMWTNFDVYTKCEVSEDTKTRREVYDTINTMRKAGKSSIEIKTILTEKYPTYEEYIIKMINQYFDKLNSKNSKKTADASRGDER